MFDFEVFLTNLRTKVKEYLEDNELKISDLKEKLTMYNQHKERVSKPYQIKMEKIKRRLNLVNHGSQASFAIAYSFLYIKLIVFNHYKRLNIPIKLGLFCLYTYTLEPLTVGTCKSFFDITNHLAFIATSLYLNSNQFNEMNDSLNRAD
jgi:hypothetical protein